MHVEPVRGQSRTSPDTCGHSCGRTAIRASRMRPLYFAPPRSKPGMTQVPPSKVFIKTFGCQMNEYDSSKMVDVLKAARGYERTLDIDD
eukprot:gene1674-2208_t